MQGNVDQMSFRMSSKRVRASRAQQCVLVSTSAQPTLYVKSQSTRGTTNKTNGRPSAGIFHQTTDRPPDQPTEQQPVQTHKRVQRCHSVTPSLRHCISFTLHHVTVSTTPSPSPPLTQSLSSSSSSSIIVVVDHCRCRRRSSSSSSSSLLVVHSLMKRHCVAARSGAAAQLRRCRVTSRGTVHIVYTNRTLRQ